MILAYQILNWAHGQLHMTLAGVVIVIFLALALRGGERREVHKHLYYMQPPEEEKADGKKDQ